MEPFCFSTATSFCSSTLSRAAEGLSIGKQSGDRRPVRQHVRPQPQASSGAWGATTSAGARCRAPAARTAGARRGAAPAGSGSTRRAAAGSTASAARARAAGPRCRPDARTGRLTAPAGRPATAHPAPPPPPRPDRRRHRRAQPAAAHPGSSSSRRGCTACATST